MFSNLSLISFLTIIFSSLTCAILGNFVLWKKISYFGDTISHSSLFAIAIAYFFNINDIFAIIIFNFTFSFFVIFSNNNFNKNHSYRMPKFFSIDAITIIMAYFFISCAFLFNEKFNNNYEFEEFIFGNIDKLNFYHLFIIISLLISAILFTIFFLNNFLLFLFSPEISRLNKINNNLTEFIFITLLSILIAFAIKITGIFLVTALMIIPPASARILAKNPRNMILFSGAFSILISILAIYLSYFLNLSPAPTIIFLNITMLAILLLYHRFYAKT